MMHSDYNSVGVRPSSDPFWNKKDLTPPPICTVPTKSGKEIRILNGAIRELSLTLDMQIIILREKKLLTTISKHYNAELHGHKGYQSVNKILQCLKRFQTLNLKTALMKYERTSSQCFTIDYQPSRQMLEYLLVRLHGLVVLMDVLVRTCDESGQLLKGMMEVGHLPSIVLMLLSVVSRIWTVSKFVLEKTIVWYMVIRPLLRFLSPTKVPWLPVGFEIPDTPYEAINAPWLDRKKITAAIRSYLSIYEEPVRNTNLDCLTVNDDLGETISRQSLVGPAPPTITVGDKPGFAPNLGNPALEKLYNQYAEPKPVVRPERHSINSRSIPNVNQSSPDLKPVVSEEVVQPVKHFFKKKLSKLSTEQEKLQREAQGIAELSKKRKSLDEPSQIRSTNQKKFKPEQKTVSEQSDPVARRTVQNIPAEVSLSPSALQANLTKNLNGNEIKSSMLPVEVFQQKTKKKQEKLMKKGKLALYKVPNQNTVLGSHQTTTFVVTSSQKGKISPQELQDNVREAPRIPGRQSLSKQKVLAKKKEIMKLKKKKSRSWTIS